MSQDFIGCHDGSPRFRRPVLVIVNGTRLGKSMLAADVLDRIARQLGLPGFLEVGMAKKRIGLHTQRLTIGFFNFEIF